MKDKQEVWITMIISAFAKKQGLSIAAATKLLLENHGIAYLADCYSTLHLLSNDDVTDELIQMTENRVVFGSHVFKTCDLYQM